jgi:hypothetical protein
MEHHINDNELNKMLRQTYADIEPPDSWEGLRGRLGSQQKRFAGTEKLSYTMRKELKRWRLVSLSLAACLLLVSGLFIYTAGFGPSIRHIHPKTAADYQRLSGKDLDNLTLAFTQVRQLFSEENPWFVIGPDKAVTIGVHEQADAEVNPDAFVVLRLVVTTDDNAPGRYYDIVTYADKTVTFQTPLDEQTDMRISIKPILEDERIKVAYETRINGGAEAKSIASLNKEKYTSLLGLDTDKGWVNIQGVARLVTDI